MDYAENYERCMKENTTFFQRKMVELLSQKAQRFGQTSHKIWSLKYIMDEYFVGKEDLKVMDCGAWDGWFLSYDTPQITQRIALDFDAHFGPDLLKQGIDFMLCDMEKGYFPVASNSLDLVAMTSTLEHLACPEHIATEIRRVLKPGGIVFITVPDIKKYKFDFWNDITHKRPFTIKSLSFLFEMHKMETLELSPYNHNFFIAANLFPKPMHKFLTTFRANSLLYVGRKPVG